MIDTATPSREIVGFHQDDDGTWVAELSCGHGQHVRHQPPWQLRPWVSSEQGRHAQLGTALGCPSCRMPPLPAGLEEYKRTAVFNADSVPAGLLRNHRLKPEVWAEIVVLEGYVHYIIEGQPPLCLVLSPRLTGAIQPATPHHVAPQAGSRFFVRFLRRP